MKNDMKTTIIIKEETIKVNEKPMIHRQIEVNNKLVFDDICSIGLFVKDKSPLKQFTDWVNDRISKNNLRTPTITLPQYPSDNVLTIEIVEQRLLQIAEELNVDVMEWSVIEEYLKRYDNKFPRVITREVLSLYFDYNSDDCTPINPNRKRIGDGFYSY